MIYFIERNIHGAWVIYGTEGVKQYYYMTKKEAISSYKSTRRTITAKKGEAE